MSDPNQTQVAATLGISVLALWSLTANPAFPQPSTNDGDGNLTWTGSAATALTTFEGLWTAALARGWKLPPAILPTANFACMASNDPGQYYGGPGSPPGTDHLWDDFP